MKKCPCSSEVRYLDCCGSFLLKKTIPATPLALMRSRYTAFVEGNMDYIKKTMKLPALAKFNKAHFKENNATIWHGLEIVDYWIDPNNPDRGYVEFIATYSNHGKVQKIHEVSEFHRYFERWYYIDGQSK